MKASDKHFLRGFGVAMADLMRLHQSEVEARDVITGAGFEIADFIAAGLDEYDLAEIRKAMT